MDYKVLYRKYRPDDFSNIIGQDYMISILKNAIKKDKISHAYIFSGPRGTGKTSTAKVFAKAINCENPGENGPCNACESCLNFKDNADIIEIDAASNNGVDEIREIINNIKLAPAYSKYKVYIIDEVHMLSTSAFNALLLTLEEPPKHVVFILATTNIEAVPITILSRCQRFDFHKISLTDIVKRLEYVVSEENIAIDHDALEEIAYISDGGMRDALSILDQLSSNNSKITINEVISNFGSVSKKQIQDLYEHIVTNNVDQFLEMMAKFKNLAIDYKLLIRKLLEQIEFEAIKTKKDYSYKGLSYENLRNMAFELAEISNYVNINIDPYLLIEITLLKYFSNSDNQNISSELPKSSSKKESTVEVPSPSPKKEEPKNTIPTPEESKVEEVQEEPKEPPKPILPASSIEDEYYTEIMNIRINNCFVNASKQYLQTLKTNWPDFISSMTNKKILNIIIDTTVVAASDTNVIITDEIDGTVNLINKNLAELDKLYEEKYHTPYHFIALTPTLWQEKRAIYIENLKNNQKYVYQEEPEKKTPEIKEDISPLEETAYAIFDKDKIEIK